MVHIIQNVIAKFGSDTSKNGSWQHLEILATHIKLCKRSPNLKKIQLDKNLEFKKNENGHFIATIFAYTAENGSSVATFDFQNLPDSCFLKMFAKKSQTCSASAVRHTVRDIAFLPPDSRLDVSLVNTTINVPNQGLVNCYSTV